MTNIKYKSKMYSNGDESIEELEKRVEKLKDKYEELHKNYIGYLGVDMNRQAGLVNAKKFKVGKEISLLESRIKLKKELKKIKEEEMYGISQKMKKDIKLYEMFLRINGLEEEFESFREKQEEEEIERNE